MEFDFPSLILGIILASAGAWVLFWSEKCSLANRLAYSCCEQAYQFIQYKFEIEKLKNPDLENFENILPIENESFRIELLPTERVQTDVHISEYFGVYSKHYDLWLIIEDTTAFLDEGISSSKNYYFCNPDFSDKQFIKNPHIFDVRKYLIKEKTQR